MSKVDQSSIVVGRRSIIRSRRQAAISIAPSSTDGYRDRSRSLRDWHADWKRRDHPHKESLA